MSDNDEAGGHLNPVIIFPPAGLARGAAADYPSGLCRPLQPRICVETDGDGMNVDPEDVGDEYGGGVSGVDGADRDGPDVGAKGDEDGGKTGGSGDGGADADGTDRDADSDGADGEADGELDSEGADAEADDDDGSDGTDGEADGELDGDGADAEADDDGGGDGTDGEADGGADSSGTVGAGEAGAAGHTPAKMRRLCWRLSAVAGRGRWIIAGPVNDHQNIDPLRFTSAIVVEALPRFSSREVYARAVRMLITKGVYASMAAAHESIRHVYNEYDIVSTQPDEPSWNISDADGLVVRRVLDNATVHMRRARGRVQDGSVKFIAFEPLSSHPWYAYKLRLLCRRGERKGALAYRRGLSKLTDDDERRLLRAGNSSALLSVRHATTYNLRTAAEKSKGLRSTKKRPWRNVAAPDLIPPRRRLFAMKRRVFERCSRVDHSMIVLDVNGDAVPWEYVRGSGLSGVRLYKSQNGTIKRLACHSHKQRKDASGSAAAASGAASASDAGNPDNEPVLDEDGDEGFPMPSESPLSAQELRILRSSTLEYADGTEAEVILAVEFDIVAGIQASIAQRMLRCSAGDVSASPTAWSLAADGGPVRRSALTIFSLALSASWLLEGRSAMVPVLYILAGEHLVHSPLAARLDKLVADAVRASYEVRVYATSGMGADDNADDSSSSDDVEDCEESVCDWTGPQLVRIVGDFSMIAHLLGLTGGSDDSRCPFWWPCSSKTFLSLTAQTSSPGGARTVTAIASQWEMACWFFARWCGLRGGLTLASGTVSARCTECAQAIPLSLPLERYVRCCATSCADDIISGADTLPIIMSTPLKNMFNRIRRRAGGVRGYPVLRSVPVVVQVPVLHCTGNIVKKLLFFFLAEQGDAVKAVAKRGIYGVTGRDGLKLYLREYIKLVALVVACEDIVGVPVESAMLSMWSLALLMTAAWRQALTAPMEDREKAIAVMELAVGLLAPLWSALKPLDKESKGSGITSLYLHAVLAHARDSLGENSPARAVVTDDNVEGQVREMGKHCKTRINNVARAQAVTELQALADKDHGSPSRGQFAAELRIYSSRVEVCSCCSGDLSPSQVADMTRAINRAKESNVITEEHTAGDQDSSSVTLMLPAALMHDDEELAEQDGERSWLSKERKVARALSERLKTLKVCLCGAIRQMQPGSIARRLKALCDAEDDVEPCDGRDGDVADDGDAANRPVLNQPATQRDRVREQSGAPAPGGVTLDDARSLMAHHTATCRMRDVGDCQGQCRGGDVDDSTDADSEGGGNGGGAGGNSVGGNNGADDNAVGGDDEQILDDSGGEEVREGRDADAVPAADDWSGVPFIASELLKDPTLRGFAPPVAPLRAFLDGDHEALLNSTEADAAECRKRIAEEDILLRLFAVRMRRGPFVSWARLQGVHLGAMYEGIESVIRKLDELREALPGAHVSTL